VPSRTIRIPTRFRGPPASANGGYTCGRVAGAMGLSSAEVTLRRPPPLETALEVDDDGQVRHGEQLIAEGRPAAVTLDVPAPVDPARAAEAARAGYEHWSARHPFPECVVCGPARRAGDGLRLCPGALREEGLFACDWIPHASLAGEDGLVHPECVWAALDCPTSAPVANFGEGPPAVLARLAASLDAPVVAGEPHAIVSWALSRDGRKRRAAAVLFDARGTVLGRSEALWIELKE
jgi:hypothetical protein